MLSTNQKTDISVHIHNIKRKLPLKLIKIVIPLVKLVNVPVGGYCKLNEQCQGSEHLVVCDHGRCVCRDGYLLSNLECREGKLKIL